MTHSPFQVLVCAALALLVSACATTGTDPEGNDPLEGWNRGVFALNKAVDQTLVKPVADIYNDVVPEPGRHGLTNFLDNLVTPWTFVNDLLQLEGGRAATSFGRFLVNTTVGIGGLFDPAANMGLPKHKEDLGQTLAVWGVGDGPYLMLPFFGPSNLRDTVGFVGEIFYDPVGIAVDNANIVNMFGTDWSILTPTRLGLEALDFRANNGPAFAEIYAAQDPYAFSRTAYRQLRDFEISNGALEESEEEADLFGEEFED